MIKRTVQLIVGILAVGAVFAGCGGDGDDDTSTATVSKASFAKQANDICTTAQKKQLVELRAEEGNVVTTTLIALRAELDQIEALDVPAGDEPEVEAMLKDLRGTIAKANPDLAKANELLAQAEEKADKLGLTKCLAS